MRLLLHEHFFIHTKHTDQFVFTDTYPHSVHCVYCDGTDKKLHRESIGAYSKHFFSKKLEQPEQIVQKKQKFSLEFAINVELSKYCRLTPHKRSSFSAYCNAFNNIV